jgi:hypothetical protein
MKKVEFLPVVYNNILIVTSRRGVTQSSGLTQTHGKTPYAVSIHAHKTRVGGGNIQLPKGRNHLNNLKTF